jgi:hypothetical protein
MVYETKYETKDGKTTRADDAGDQAVASSNETEAVISAKKADKASSKGDNDGKQN